MSKHINIVLCTCVGLLHWICSLQLVKDLKASAGGSHQSSMKQRVSASIFNLQPFSLVSLFNVYVILFMVILVGYSLFHDD